MRNSARNLRELSDVAQVIKQYVSCLDIARDYGMDPDRRGYVKCPFHDDHHPSMQVYTDQKGFYCFSCKKHGDIFNLFQQITGMNFAQAVHTLSRDYNLNLLEDEKLAADTREIIRKRKEAEERKKQAERQAHEDYLNLADREREIKNRMADIQPTGPDDPKLEEYNALWSELQGVREDITDAQIRETYPDVPEPESLPLPEVREDPDLCFGRFRVEDFSTSAPYLHLLSLSDMDREFAKNKAREWLKAHKVPVTTFDRQYAAVSRSVISNRAKELPGYTDLPGLPQPAAAEDLAECTQRRVNQQKYIVSPDGIFANTQEGTVRISATPFLPVYKTRNIDTGVVQICIGVQDARGAWMKYLFDQDILYDAQKIKSLAKFGIGITSETARLAVQYMEDLMTWNSQELMSFESIGRLGWIDERCAAFVPYDMELKFSGDVAYKELFESVSTAGTLEGWLDAAREVREGNSVAARIMLAASFASPMLEAMNFLPFVVHCWSTVSGIGKTVALKLAASVWGYPERYMMTFNSTTVAFERLCGVLYSLPLCLDELQTAKGTNSRVDVQSAIYNLTEGKGRTRGARFGGLQQVDRWHNSIIVTGEEPLTDARSKAGAVNRVLDIEAGDIPMFANGNLTVQKICENYGHAGKMIVDVIRKASRQELSLLHGGFQMKLLTESTPKQAQAGAVILLADLLATRYIFKDDRALTIDEVMPLLARKDDVDVNKRCYQWLMDDITTNVNRYVPDPERGYVGEVWGMMNDDASVVSIIKNIFDKRLSDNGFSPKGFLEWCRREGLLVAGDSRHTTSKVRIQGMVIPIRCVRLKMFPDRYQIVEEASEPLFAVPEADQEPKFTPLNEDAGEVF